LLGRAIVARSDNLLKTRRTQRVRDLDVGARIKGQQWRPYRCVLENSTRDEAMLERDRSFHVRSAVIDGASYRKQPVMDRTCLRVVLGFAGRNELDKWLRCKTAISHQRAVHVEHRVKQIFVMAGKNLQIGTLTTDNRNFGVPPAHVAHAVLHGENTRQRRDVELGLEIVRGLGRVRILKEDQRQAAFLVNCPVAILRRTFLIAEPKPAVRGVDQPGLRPGLYGPLCLLRSYLGAFKGDSRDDGDLSVN
jgi:hypothetical protein